MEVKKSMIFPIIATWKESATFLNSTSFGKLDFLFSGEVTMERTSFSSLPTLEARKNENKAAIVSGGQRAATPLGRS